MLQILIVASAAAITRVFNLRIMYTSNQWLHVVESWIIWGCCDAGSRTMIRNICCSCHRARDDRSSNCPKDSSIIIEFNIEREDEPEGETSRGGTNHTRTKPVRRGYSMPIVRIGWTSWILILVLALPPIKKRVVMVPRWVWRRRGQYIL
jgi:hypothetical protein